jgi:hypothetical protein
MFIRTSDEGSHILNGKLHTEVTTHLKVVIAKEVMHEVSNEGFQG